ncbi:MAG: DUF4388 domain-containing protein [Candidatus Eisenbacteria bacterium]
MHGVPDGPGPDDLVGSLRVASLLDLCQFLLLSSKSGTLSLTHGESAYRLFFDKGEIVNAVDERQGREGRDVALQLFRIPEGAFRFRQGPVHERNRIETGTENLLLDAARMMDEIGEALHGGGPESSQEKELKEKQEKGQALRSLFSSLEEDLTRSAEVPPLEKIVEEAEKAGADGFVLTIGHRPALLRGGRVLIALPGLVGPVDIERTLGRMDGGEEIPVPGAAYLMNGDPGEGRLAFRRRSRSAAALEDLNLPPGAVKSLLLRPPGLLFLVAESDGVRRYLYEGIVRHLDRIGEVVVCLDEPFGEEGKGLLVRQRLRPGSAEDRAALQSLLSGLSGARVVLPRTRDEGDARLLLDLARSGHTALTTLPGREGGEALRRAVSWFAPMGGLRGVAPLLSGMISLQLHAGEGGRAIPVTSVAPWTDEARKALEKEDYAALSAALERGAGENGFAGSLERLVRGKGTKKSEADRIASLIMNLVGAGA